MIDRFMYTTIITLWKQKKSKSEIARIVGCDRKTIRRNINKYQKQVQEQQQLQLQSQPQPQPQPQQETIASYGNYQIHNKTTKFDHCKDKIIELMEQDLTAIRIYEEMTAAGFIIGYRTVSRYVANIKGNNNICVRFHTKPGEEAQVDFGYIGYLPDLNNKLKKAWVFNMRLSYSRLDYYEIVFDQRVETFIHCHINAFRSFGGVPHVIKIDNLKAAILEAHLYEVVHQALYKKFADYYQFNILACRVRQPQEKGKTEAGIKYIQINFFAGRKFIDHQDLILRLNNWLHNKCNLRVHGTTKRVPKSLFESEERNKLTALPIADFILPDVGTRKVYRDCHITIDGNYYSVPYEYVGKTVEIELDIKLVKIIYQGNQVATHIRSTGKGNHVTNPAHYPKYKMFDPCSKEYQSKYLEKMKAIGENACEILTMLLNKQPYNWHRMAQGIISLKRIYTTSVIDLACKRALVFGVVSYGKIKAICQSGSYALPMDELYMSELGEAQEQADNNNNRYSNNPNSKSNNLDLRYNN